MVFYKAIKGSLETVGSGLDLSDNSESSRTGDQSDSHGAAFTSDLAGYDMRVNDLVVPVTFSDGGDVELGVSDGSLDFFVAFLTESDMDGAITN